MREASIKRRVPTIRYRCPLSDGNPSVGHILMGEGPRVRRAYRVLTIEQALKGRLLALGGGEYAATWRLSVEPMSAARGREEAATGVPVWSIQWDKRERRRA